MHGLDDEKREVACSDVAHEIWGPNNVHTDRDVTLESELGAQSRMSAASSPVRSIHQ